MCEECVKAKAELFPDLTDEEFEEILWEYTCHPAGGYPRIREQLEEYARDPQGVIARQEAFCRGCCCNRR